MSPTKLAARIILVLVGGTIFAVACFAAIAWYLDERDSRVLAPSAAISQTIAAPDWRPGYGRRALSKRIEQRRAEHGTASAPR